MGLELADGVGSTQHKYGRRVAGTLIVWALLTSGCEPPKKGGHPPPAPDEPVTTDDGGTPPPEPEPPPAPPPSPPPAPPPEPPGFSCDALTPSALTSGGASCDDRDGNGIPDHPAHDPFGAAYCVDLVLPDIVRRGERVTATARFYHEDGGAKIFVVQDQDYHHKLELYCSESFCTVPVELDTDAVGLTRIDVLLFGPNYSYLDAMTRDILVECDEEHCDGDQALSSFIHWLRAEGYSDCVVDHYLTVLQDREALTQIRDAMRSGEPLPRTVSVPLVDVIPTDRDTTARSLADSEARDCDPVETWPEWCSHVRPAGVTFLEEHLSRTYGVDVHLEYEQLPLNYEQTFGAPDFRNGAYAFGDRFEFLEQFADHAIVHFAIETFHGDPVGDMTGGSSVVEISLEPFNVMGAVTYSHEWGHSWGLPHSFYENGDGDRVFYDLDGIMDNTYRRISELVDPISPLERYILAPAGGFLNGAASVEQTNEATESSTFVRECTDRTLGIEEATITRADATSVAIELEFSDVSPRTMGFVWLRAYDGCMSGRLIEERELSYLCAEASDTMTQTFERASLVSNEILFLLETGGSICVQIPDDAATSSCEGTSCASCIRSDGCGWSAAHNRCMAGDEAGSSDGSSAGPDWFSALGAC